MERDIQDYYEDMIEMFATKGWQTFIEQNEEQLDRLEKTAYADCANNDLWQERRGEIKRVLTIVNYEPLIRANFENVVENEKIAEQENLH